MAKINEFKPPRERRESPMKWSQTHNTDDLSVWTSGSWKIKGYGRRNGQKLVRDWKLFRVVDNGDGTTRLREQGGDFLRLSEAKQWAWRHRESV